MAAPDNPSNNPNTPTTPDEPNVSPPVVTPSGGGGILGAIEWLGNKLPDPIFLFISATVLVMVLSAIGSAMEWTVQPVRPQVVMETITGPAGEVVRQPKLDAAGRPLMELIDTGAPIRPRSLLTSDGIYWLIVNMVRNFINFAPLGVVLVSMFGIGVAERVGLFGAAMRYLASIVPSKALTPTVVFLGIMSNTASDAGYIILPALAAALYMAYGRSPMAGIAAAFAGVSAGFSANLIIASTDALVASLTERGAQVLDPSFAVVPTCNWYFMAVSTFLLTLTGWFVTARIVEPRLNTQRALLHQVQLESQELSRTERRGLLAALAAMIITIAGITILFTAPNAPLNGAMPAPAPHYGPIPVAPVAAQGEFSPAAEPAEGQKRVAGSLTAPAGIPVTTKTTIVLEGGEQVESMGTFRTGEPVTASGVFEKAPDPQPRWSQAVVPLILVGFLVPGLAYGLVTGSVRRPADVSNAFIYSMSSMAPIVAMSFFAAQFIECFRFSQLDAMLANAGGKALVAAELPKPLLLVGVILLVMVVNVLMSSMSAKWTALSMILVPMLMMAGLSPQLSQTAYRVGDSVTNTITPLNSYIIVILAVVQRYRKDAGIGNLIAMMIPYSAIFFVVWTIFLLLWVWLGIPLGPGGSGPLWYTPGHH
jgi:aminobenzoyl-glutamate transport protein